MKKLFFGLLLLILIVLTPLNIQAQEPANNTVGVHLSDLSEEQLRSSAVAVNGNGGQWGYVTVAITLGQCQSGELQRFFDSARRKKLIPLVRLTTEFDSQKGVYKRVVNSTTARTWVDCLGNLKWPTKMRQVILFNEVNRGTEYEGGCDAANYATVAQSYAKELHEFNKNFVVMLSGLDLYAPQASPQYCDAAIFTRGMIRAVPSLFDNIDALASHCYPADDYTAAPTNSGGRHSILCYNWELEQLRQNGVTKDLPVYITETGWRHNPLSESTVASYTQTAYEIWQKDARVKAATPFILSYCGVPFVDFSWKNCLPNQNGGYDVATGFKPVYQAVLELPKVSGDPEQIHTANLIMTLPKKITVGGTYRFTLHLENDPTSTAIWDSRDGYNLKLIDGKGNAASFANLFNLEPGKVADVVFSFLPGEKLGSQTISIGLFKENTLILKLADWMPTILPKATLTLNINQLLGNGNDCGLKLKIFDVKEKLVFAKDGLCSKGGLAVVDEITGIIFDEKYRVVVIKDGYLPVENNLVFDTTANVVTLPVLLPFDRNNDGKLSFGDLKN